MSALENIQQLSSECIQLFNESKEIVPYKQDYPTLICERIGSLLETEKPRLMVCGVYSAGKSTIVNVLCRKDVAEVGAQPKTDRVTSYDECKDYILVDSPGVDAPIEHEQITDDFVKKSSALMFVISTKNAESEANYRKISEWMKYEKPLIVVLNDKTGNPDLNNSEVEKVRLKVAENFRRIGLKKSDSYEVIVVNAQMAWKALQSQNELAKNKLFNASNIQQLETILNRNMKNGYAIFLAPIEELRRVLDDMETELIAISTNNDAKELQAQLAMIEREGVRISESIKRQIRAACDNGKANLIQACMTANSKEEIDQAVANVSSQIANTIDEDYQSQIGRLANVVNSSMDSYGIHMSSNGMINIKGTDVDFNKMVDTASEIGGSGGALKDMASGAILGEMLGTAAGKVAVHMAATAVAPVLLAGAGGTVASVLAGLPLGPIGMIGGAIVGILIGRRKREQQEAEIQAQIEEENRKRQEAIDAHYKKVQAEVGASMEAAETAYSQYATELFARAISNLKNMISLKISDGESYNEKVASYRRKVSEMKAELDCIKTGLQ